MMIIIDIIGFAVMGGLAIVLERASEQEVEPLKVRNCFDNH